jgi:hypothetical protein
MQENKARQRKKQGNLGDGLLLSLRVVVFLHSLLRRGASRNSFAKPHSALPRLFSVIKDKKTETLRYWTELGCRLENFIVYTAKSTIWQLFPLHKAGSLHTIL